MTAHLKYLRYAVLDSFWFLPALLLATSVGLALLSVAVDRSLQEYWQSRLSWIFWIGPSGAREILAVIAGSMITATSLVFSMTLVALTLASSQLGPRLLAIFRADRTTQLALGVFVATLAYALLMLRLVGAETEAGDALVPIASVTVAQLLTIVSLALLIYFIHHLAQILEADTVVSHVGKELDANVRDLFPEASRCDRVSGAEAAETGTSERFWVRIESAATGYVQTMAERQLIALAEAADGRIDLLARPGDFLLAGQPLARFWPLDRITSSLKQEICGCVAIGSKRTQAEDLEYAANALVEIALRALSPSLNDPFTAIACINQLGAALAIAAGREDPPLRRHGSDGSLRLLLPQRGFVELLEGSFNDVRRAGAEHPAVLAAILRILCSLAAIAADPGRRVAIERQGEAIRRIIERLEEPLDRQRVEVGLEELQDQLRRWEA